MLRREVANRARPATGAPASRGTGQHPSGIIGPAKRRRDPASGLWPTGSDGRGHFPASLLHAAAKLKVAEQLPTSSLPSASYASR
jgi:hypothetical protein